MNDSPAKIPTKTSAFVKGGCGCLLLFLAFVMLCGLAALCGANVQVHGNLLGLVLFLLFLFLIGGGLGLLVRWIYKKGVDAGNKP